MLGGDGQHLYKRTLKIGGKRLYPSGSLFNFRF